jgi:dienelactone hydrolase
MMPMWKRTPLPRRSVRRRDSQQWILDWIVKTTGRVQNFERDERIVPAGAKSYRMAAKLLGEEADHQFAVAQEAEKHGHTRTAMEMYWKASLTYREGQHCVFEDDHPRKIYLHGRLLESYDRIMKLADYPIERIEVPFQGKSLQGILHLLPDRRKAPCVIYVPGMDQTKEIYPDPLNNHFLHRGMHMLSIDGPGQGISNLRKIRVTDDNYERAGKAFIDYLVKRPEVDAGKIGLFGISMGSFWAPRIAAHDHRVAACAAATACFLQKDWIFNQSSPRFKQVFMYMAGLQDEAKFDKLAEKMTLQGYGKKIECPILLATGEFDPLSPVEDAYALFDELRGPKELWVWENEAHALNTLRGAAGLDIHPLAADWLREKLEGRYDRKLAREVYIRQNGRGPYVDSVERAGR